MLMVNQWDRATVTVAGGTPVPTLPITNSQVYGRSLTSAITPDENGQSVIEFSLPEFVLMDGLVMYRHWLSNAANWRLELFDDEHCGGNKVFDSGTQEAVLTKTLGDLDWLADPLVATIFETWPFKFSQLWLDTPTFAFSGRITLTDTQARDGIHEFDRVYLGRSVQPGVNFNWGAEHAWQSNEQQRKSAAGSVFGTAKPKLRQFSFEMAHLVEEERPLLSNGIKHVGQTKDWFVSLYPQHGGQKEIDYAMACKFAGLPSVSGPAYNTFTARFTLQEA